MIPVPAWIIATLLDRAADALQRHDNSYHYLTPNGLIKELQGCADMLREQEEIADATA